MFRFSCGKGPLGGWGLTTRKCNWRSVGSIKICLSSKYVVWDRNIMFGIKVYVWNVRHQYILFWNRNILFANKIFCLEIEIFGFPSTYSVLKSKYSVWHQNKRVCKQHILFGIELTTPTTTTTTTPHKHTHIHTRIFIYEWLPNELFFRLYWIYSNDFVCSIY